MFYNIIFILNKFLDKENIKKLKKKISIIYINIYKCNIYKSRLRFL